MTKKIELSSIQIEHIIVHDIPKHKKDDLTIKPTYSERESKISDGLRYFFKDKVIQALGSDRSFKICFENNSSSPISWIIKEMLSSKEPNIVQPSKAMTKHLYEQQVGSNAAGILVVILGKLNTSNICIILKLERDEGAQLNLNPHTHSFNIDEVKNLMLTTKTKIFKVALFILNTDFGAKYDGILMDYQIDVKLKKEVRTWFIDKFLGCKAFEDPKITTQLFYNYTRTYIQTIEDEIEKIKYIQDLNSYVQKNIQYLNPKDFADDYLKTSQQKNDYKNYLEEKRFSFTAFPKDNSQIERRFKKIVVLFENDISVIGNKGSFRKGVILEKLPNGQTRVEFTSKIKNIS